MGMNLLGVDVSTLDVPAFLAGTRQAFPLLALLWLAVLVRLRRPWWLLLGVLAANAWVWGATNYPLQRLYGLGPSHDRIGNLGLCQVVAAGNSPLHTTQLGQLHFEPFWGMLVALVSGFDPDRVLALYPFFSLVMVIAFPLALFFGLKTGETEGFSPWERALLAGFATLLSSSALDYLGTYRVPWAKMFLLKPNHALGLVLLPLFLAVFVRIRSLRGRLGAGLLLHLLGWAFVLHMAYVCVGLLVFAGLSLVTRHPEARRDQRDVLTVIGVNLLVVSPYLVMLLAGYPFLVPSSRYGSLPAFSPHLLEPTLRTGAVFWLGLWGLLVLSRRGDRMSRLFLGQVLGGYLIWIGYLVLSLLGLARERDEIYFWLRILTAGGAALGVWDLTARAASWLGREAWSPAGRAAVVGMLALPFALPTWWDPARMDAYFAGSLPPLPASLTGAGEFLRHHSEPQAVLAGDPQLTRYAAALVGRRGLVVAGMNATGDWKQRLELQKQLLNSENPWAVSQAAARYHIGYLLVDPAYLAEHSSLTLADLDRKRHLRRVHLAGDPDGDFVAIYQVGSP